MYSKSNSDSQFNKVMSDEQFNQVVDAILSGKYSWACLLILRFSGYNPLHYIPYRTYNRLMKANRDLEKQKLEIAKSDCSEELRFKQKKTRKLQDIYYLEDAERQSAEIKGGKQSFFANKVVSRLFP